MMYFYWRYGRVRPSVFYQMPRGELTVIQAFFEKEMEDRKEEIRQIQNKARK